MARQNNKIKNAGFLIGGVAFGLIVMGLSGCNQYFDRQDPITLGAGESVAQNKVTHTVQPWPPGSKNPHHATNGARALIAVRRYEKNESIEPEPIRSQAIQGGATK